MLGLKLETDPRWVNIVETNIEDFPLSDIFDTLAAEAGAGAERKGLELRVRPTNLWVRSDKALLRRIIQNFLSNALRYTENGGVLLGARRRGESVLIETYDTGPGIAKDKQGLIFEEFRRLHPSSAKDSKAMGLGLAIVDRIATLLGHTVTLRSREGKGSCFALRLEGAMAKPSVEAEGAEYGGVRIQNRFHSAILIENELQILAGMVELLETRNIKAVPAVSAQEAADALDTMEHMPDMIIADYHLDEGTGVEAVELIRRKCGRALPAIIVTANHTPTLKSVLARKDIALLWKPIKPRELFDTIEAALLT